MAKMAVFSWSLMKILASIIAIDAKNTFTLHETLKNGETLISSNNRFELGFFNVSSTTDSNRELKYYFGVWYRGIEPLTPVWVANRMEPLQGSRVELHMNLGGNLFVRDDEGNAVCFVRLNEQISRPTLVLMDSGNLVLNGKVNGVNRRYVWQSFDSPSDTLLPGMKLGWDFKSKANRVLTSWNGDYVVSLNTTSLPRLVLEKNGVVQSMWNGERFSGLMNNHVFRVVYHYSDDEAYFTVKMSEDSILLRLVVTSVGAVQFLKWSNGAWVPMVTLTKDDDICDKFGSCGPYSTCNPDDQGCRCLKGFLVNSPYDRRTLDFSGGCRRRNALNCSDGDGFVKYNALKLPSNFTVLKGMSFARCADYCLKECNCTAYTYGRHRDCLVWLGDLVDFRVSTQDGDELYIRMARVELDTISHSKKRRNIAIISSQVAAVLIIMGAAVWFVRAKFKWPSNNLNIEQDLVDENEDRPVQDEDQFVQLFDMKIVSAATRSFALENKIGQGGFGPVYKGTLQNGEKVAVKRLSETSKQGLQEFKNEAQLIAKLQHRNLVKLIGCCIHGKERMLIYEYMPNKSLDKFIFDPARRRLLNWEKRLSILKGVAKGLDYIHFGSRMRIVHRDLKASNVLLDEHMNPKISDFGLATICENEVQETSMKVLGTYGYMSPEYVLDGRFSTKSDVFSYGVLVIETLSGQRNWGFENPDHELNLLGYAWRLWNEGRIMEMIDPVVLEESNIVGSEVIRRCVQIGLICAQHVSQQRPVMSQVVNMLEDENVGLEEPQEPGFYKQNVAARDAQLVRSFGWMMQDESVNGLTITELTGRTSLIHKMNTEHYKKDAV